MSHAKIDDKSGEIFISDHKKSYQTHADVADMSSLGDHSHKTDIPRINSHYARFINVSECIPRKNIIETNEILHRRQDQKYEKLLDSAAIAAESSKALNELLSAKLLEVMTCRRPVRTNGEKPLAARTPLNFAGG